MNITFHEFWHRLNKNMQIGAHGTRISSGEREGILQQIYQKLPQILSLSLGSDSKRLLTEQELLLHQDKMFENWCQALESLTFLFCPDMKYEHSETGHLLATRNLFHIVYDWSAMLNTETPPTFTIPLPLYFSRSVTEEVQKGNLKSLGGFFQSLSADRQTQQKALQSLQLVLDPWEFFCVVFMHALKAANNQNARTLPFYSVLTEDGVLVPDEYISLDKQNYVDSARLDSARILSIVFAKILLWLLNKESDTQHFRDVRTRGHAIHYSQKFVVFIRSFEEIVLKGHSREQRSNELTTGLLESSFLSVIALQDDLLERVERDRGQLKQGAILMDLESAYFQALKRLFRKPFGAPEAVGMEARNFRRNSLADIAQVWLKTMQPWSNKYDFFQSLVDLGTSQEPLNNSLADSLCSAFVTRSRAESGAMLWQFQNESLAARSQLRRQWGAYVKRMSLLYIELASEFFVAMLKKSSLTLEDLIVWKQVSGKTSLLTLFRFFLPSG